jgi:carbonic anhydrase
MFDDTHDRAAFLRTAGAAAVAGIALGRGADALAAASESPGPSLTPGQALRRLMAGNARFVRGSLKGGGGITRRRVEVAAGQTPFAVVLTCADSRVPPEYIFDQSLGDIFDCRVAGNILQPAILGSIEYAVAHFHSPLLVVLGHQRCGAVTDTVELVGKGEKAPGSIQSIVEAIRPAVTATPRGSSSEKDYVEAVIRTNARLVARSLPERSAILGNAVRAKKLRIVPARYSLDSGKVILLA